MKYFHSNEHFVDSKIITSNLPRKEQDILILLVVDENTIDQKRSWMHITTPRIHPILKMNSQMNQQTNQKMNPQMNQQTNQQTNPQMIPIKFNPMAVMIVMTVGSIKQCEALYDERNGRTKSKREVYIETDTEKCIQRDDSKAWELHFPNNTIWGNWVYSYSK